MLFVPNAADAQLTDITQTANSVAVSLNPRYPRPLQQFTISVENYSIDISRAEISWYIDDVLIERGVARKQFTTKMGELGSVTNVRVELRTANGGIILKEISLEAIDVNLIWEADTVTPPFYRGKPLATITAPITVTAIPNFYENGVALNPGELIYKWKHNYEPLEDKSGFGMSTLSFTGANLFNEDFVTVEVSNLDNTLAMERTLILRPSDPVIAFYPVNPLSGANYQHALSEEIDLTEQEIVLEAVPYYFSRQSYEDDTLHFTWLLNGATVESNPDQQRWITLRQEGGSGQARVTAEVSDPNNRFLSLAQSILINFGLAGLTF